MSSSHEFAARRAFESSLEQRGAAALYAEVELGRQSLWCESENCTHALERDVVGQPFQAVESLEQLWCRGLIENLFQTGQVRRVAFRVGGGPHADRMSAENQADLDAGLADRPLTAIVRASSLGGYDDGDVAWSEPLEFLSEEEGVAGLPGAVVLPPGRAPLEIGYTLPSRTWLHLYEDGAVWRWPYGSELLWLLAAVAPHGNDWMIRPLVLDIDLSQVAPPPS